MKLHVRDQALIPILNILGSWRLSDLFYVFQILSDLTMAWNTEPKQVTYYKIVYWQETVNFH